MVRQDVGSSAQVLRGAGYNVPRRAAGFHRIGENTAMQGLDRWMNGMENGAVPVRNQQADGLVLDLDDIACVPCHSSSLVHRSPWRPDRSVGSRRFTSRAGRYSTTITSMHPPYGLIIRASSYIRVPNTRPSL